MPDYTDDWWDSTPAFWNDSPPIDKNEYRIMRAQKVPSIGSPGFLVQWKIYRVYATAKERDAAIMKLNKEHPAWRLRASSGNPYLERLGGPLPHEGINK